MQQGPEAADPGTGGAEQVSQQVSEQVVQAVPILNDPWQVLAVLLTLLAVLFAAAKTGPGKKVFNILPLLLWCYFVPSALSNISFTEGATLIPRAGSFELYKAIKDYLLPASLMLLILSVDLPGILRLGKNAVILFGVAVLTIMFGGPLAYLAWGWLVDPEVADTAWRGMAALSGSWIGGGANMVAIQESVSDVQQIGEAGRELLATFMGVVIVVDVAVANVWMAVLLYFAGNNKKIDEQIGADRTSLEAVEKKAEQIHLESARPTELGGLLAISAIAIAGAVLSGVIAGELDALVPDDSSLRQVVSRFTWQILLVTVMSIGLSFSPLRKLEGMGASKVGSVFLYLLVASIGAKADFVTLVREFDTNWVFLLIGFTWMAFHAGSMLLIRWKLRAPIFFAAVGSKSCVGGAASAPIVAAAFNPVLAPVGVLLAIGGYIFGTVAGLGCAWLLSLVNALYHG